jgi:hypothetical protein
MQMEVEKKAMMNKTVFGLSVVVVVAIALFHVSFVVGAACPGGNDFTKVFKGDASSVSHVEIVDATGHVYFNGSLPESDTVHFGFLQNKTVLTISWIDWRGTKTEDYTVIDTGNHSVWLKNCIPYPILGQAEMSSGNIQFSD